MKNLVLNIISNLYGFAIKLRHLMFDWGLLHSKSFDIPVICVGNITIGGTGKTPIVELLVREYSGSYNVAVLSRGYGRITKGVYREVQVEDHYLDVGDEPLQIKRKFPNVKVVVCADRVFAIKRIQAESPEIDMIIMDDGYQHRHVNPFFSIIAVDFTRPVEHDHLVPYGQLRDTTSTLRRANCFVVTKCPAEMQPIQMRLFKKVLVELPKQDVFFTRVKADASRAVFADVEGSVAYGSEVIAMSGIGNSDAFKEGLAERYKVVDAIDFDDHHPYRKNDLTIIEDALKRHPRAVIMTTEKDAVKLSGSTAIPQHIRERLFYEPITLLFYESDEGYHSSPSKRQIVPGFNDTAYKELIEMLNVELKNRNNERHIKGLRGHS